MPIDNTIPGAVKTANYTQVVATSDDLVQILDIGSGGVSVMKVSSVYDLVNAGGTVSASHATFSDTASMTSADSATTASHAVSALSASYAVSSSRSERTLSSSNAVSSSYSLVATAAVSATSAASASLWLQSGSYVTGSVGVNEVSGSGTASILLPISVAGVVYYIEGFKGKSS